MNVRLSRLAEVVSAIDNGLSPEAAAAAADARAELLHNPVVLAGDGTDNAELRSPLGFHVTNVCSGICHQSIGWRKFE